MFRIQHTEFMQAGGEYVVASRTRVLRSDPGEDNERRIGDLVV